MFAAWSSGSYWHFASNGKFGDKANISKFEGQIFKSIWYLISWSWSSIFGWLSMGNSQWLDEPLLSMYLLLVSVRRWLGILLIGLTLLHSPPPPPLPPPPSPNIKLSQNLQNWSVPSAVMSLWKYNSVLGYMYLRWYFINKKMLIEETFGVLSFRIISVRGCSPAK